MFEPSIGLLNVMYDWMPTESLFSQLGEPRDEPWCVAFSNTVSSRSLPGQTDRLADMETLRTWLKDKGILNGGGFAVGEDPRNFDRAIRLREAIYGVAHALSSGQPPSDDDLADINWNVQKALVGVRIDPSDTGLEWNLDSLRTSIAGAIGLLALSAAGLFTSERADRVKECGNETCGWLFVDLSKNHSRKWCDMADCGNLAKARRYYAKQKAARSVIGDR